MHNMKVKKIYKIFIGILFSYFLGFPGKLGN